ncbi:helix-turn-helix domain-containing protein [Tissierella carlieri]|uniref:Helix-turn-helix domain-containing protein n=1 Tax=Tissierella carlieri TaxID=689904 RepID=A0ABT1SEP4_9FIRM|nr:helix-turn-helix transcriptional regulator [Tissierella carlieri]MCQ4924949.1 helix-turn-helix domain-containing protein [Tissierella carlieri]
MSIGDRIRFKRKSLRLTIQELHEKTGLSIGNISDLENNKYSPSVATLLPLSKALKCSIDWLITGSNHEDNLQEFDCSDIEYKIIQMFRSLDERDKEDIFNLLDFKYNRTLKQK